MHHGEKVRLLLEKYDITVDVFGKEYLDRSRPATYAFLKKDQFSKAEIALLCQLFNLPVSFFDKPIDYFRTPFNKGKDTSDSIVEFQSFSSSDIEGGQIEEPFVKKYFQTIIGYLQRANQRLWIYDYLEKSKGELPIVFTAENKQYFEEIESLLKKRADFDYQRILALPYISEGTEDGGVYLDEALKKAIELLYPEVFRHLCVCFHQFPNQLQLFAIKVPYRLYSFGIIDDVYTISEYNHYNRVGKAKPDILFVNQVNSSIKNDPIQKFLAVYRSDFEKLTTEGPRSPRKRITKEKFIEATFAVLQEKEKKLEKAKTDREALAIRLRNSKASDQPILESDSKSMETMTKLAKLSEELLLLKKDLADIQEKVNGIQKLFI